MSDVLTSPAPLANKRAGAASTEANPLPRQAETGMRTLLDGASRYQEKQALIETLVGRAEGAASASDLAAVRQAAAEYRHWQARQRQEGRGV